jgi:hypothetical protein
VSKFKSKSKRNLKDLTQRLGLELRLKPIKSYIEEEK